MLASWVAALGRDRAEAAHHWRSLLIISTLGNSVLKVDFVSSAYKAACQGKTHGERAEHHQQIPLRISE